MRDRLMKPRPKKLDLGGGECVWLRSLTLAESFHAVTLPTDFPSGMLQQKYTIAKSVVDESGKAAFTDENDPALNDLPLELVNALYDRIANLSNSGSFEAIEKN